MKFPALAGEDTGCLKLREEGFEQPAGQCREGKEVRNRDKGHKWTSGRTKALEVCAVSAEGAHDVDTVWTIWSNDRIWGRS